MIILPAIDIKDGKCVRLFKGDFNKTTEYEKSPADQAQEFSNFGLLEMTRQRTRLSLLYTVSSECPECKGQLGIYQLVVNTAR